MRFPFVPSKFVAGLAAAAIAATPFTGSAADPYEINVIVPLSGPAAFIGKEEVNGLSVLEDMVNRSGGVRGRPIKFVVQDDQSNAQIAVELTNAVIAKKVPIILGSSFVSSCNAMAPLAANGPVVYCFSPGIHPAPGSYVFSAGSSTFDFIVASIRWLRERGLKKVAIMTSTDATGQDAERGIDAAVNAAENNGTVSLVDREHFNTTDLSVSAQIAHIKASGALAAMLWSVGTSFGTLLREAVQGGLTIPLLTSAGNLNFAQLQGYASFMPDTLYMMAPPWADASRLPSPAVRRTIAAYQDAFKPTGVRPDEGQSLSWDAALLVIDALKRYGTTASATQIRDYLAGVHGWTGVNGVYDFGRIPQRGVGIDWLVMVRWDKTNNALVAVSKPGGMPL